MARISSAPSAGRPRVQLFSFGCRVWGRHSAEATKRGAANRTPFDNQISGALTKAAGLSVGTVSTGYRSSLMNKMEQLDAQLASAKSHLRSLQDRLRLAEAETSWLRKLIPEAEERVAQLERAVAYGQAAETRDNATGKASSLADMLPAFSLA